MLDLGLALFLALVAAGIGKRLLNWIGELPDHPLDALALATPLGLGLLALGCLLLGQAGWLNLVGLAVLLGVVTELGLLAGFRLLRELARHSLKRPEKGLTTVVDRLLLVFLVLTLGATALAALAPVTDGDALCYHLQVPKVFLVRQAVYFDPDLHETVYPLVTELLYAIGLEFRGPVACRCLQWVLGLVFAAGVAALARPSLGRRAWWAAALAVLVPAISNGMAAPLNDVSLAAFGVAAFLAWTRCFDRPSRASTVVAGAFTGLAIGVKYPALVLAALLTAATLLRPVLDPAWRSRQGAIRTLMMAAGFLGTAVLLGGAWYLRAYVYTGNPVFPFFKSWFGGAGLDEVLAPIKRPLAVNVWSLLGAIVPLTLEPDRFDSFAHQFGPVFLLFLPALLFEGAPRRVLGLAAVAYAFLVVCMTQRQSMRFLLFAVGPMSVGIAYLATRWLERGTRPARALVMALMLVLGLETGLSLTRGARAAGVVLGKETFAEFLGRCEPTYRVGRWVARNLPATARLIGQDHRGFYIPRGYTMELAHRRRTGLGQNNESSREIVEVLKREGYTHLMMCPPVEKESVEFDPTLGQLLSPWLAAQTPLFHEDLADPDGVVRSYSIYGLGDEAVGAHAKGSLPR
ncbi:MAG: glycosyltransferase family 39 protein [Isosphaeraceae bacterium]